MDDASLLQDPNMMGDGQNMMSGDPNMEMYSNMDADPNTGIDPNIGDTNMETDQNAMGDTNSTDNASDDTASIINQLSDEDKEAVRSYAKSILKKDETQKGGEMNSQDGNAPMMEQVIFSKKQLNTIKENFGPSQDELMKKNDRKELPKKQSSKIKDSPFSAPKFQY